MTTGLATRLSPIDLSIVALYLVAITIFGLKVSKRKSGAPQSTSLKTYFLADNTIPWWAIALSIVSAETSTLTIVSIPGVAFAGDLGFLQIVMGYMVGRIVVALLFLPKYFRGEMLTAYQLIDQRFGAVLHKVTAGLFLLTRAAAEGVRVFAISIVVSIAIGTGDTLSIAIISALTLLYTFEGGLAAVIWTDVVQMGLYVAGTLVALWAIGHGTAGGWAHIHAVAAPLGKFHVFNFALNLTQTYTFWAGLLGGSFLTMASHGTDQLMVQRMLAARNLRESRLALLSSGVVILLQFTLFLLIGVGLFVFYGLHPQVFASSDRIFPTFIVQQMPRGVAGLLVAAILAAAMSNLSAALNSLASTTVIDFYVPIRKLLDRRVMLGGAPRGAVRDALSKHSEGSAPATSSSASRATTLVSRAATIFWAFVLFGIAVYSIQHGGKGHVVETGLSIASVAYGCLLGVFLLGTLTRFATQWGAIAGMLCGFVLNLAIWQSSLASPFVPMAIPHIAFTWYVLIGSVVTFALGSLFSWILPKPQRALTGAMLLLAIGMCGSSFAQSVGSTAVTSTPDFSPVSALITQAVADRKLPGAVLLVGHDNHIVFQLAYGNRAQEPAIEPMTRDTLFDMASLTKVLVTTTSVLQLYEAGKLELDAPVAMYLPAFVETGGTARGPDKARITVRNLLTHYSGLPEDIALKDEWGLAAPDSAEGIRRALAASPDAPAGAGFKYSDINFILLGYLVETLSGQALDVYAREHIFTPLGMASTRYHPFDKTCGPVTKTGAAVMPGPKPVGRIGVVCPPDTWSPYALTPTTAPTAHDNEGSATTNPDFDHILRGTVHDPSTRRMGGVAGHAGVFSNAADTAKFAQALLDRLLHDTGPFPLKQATLRLATTPNEPASAVSTATIFTPDGQVTKGVASRGLGWDLNSPFSRPRGEIFPISIRATPGSFGHTGFTGTSLWIDPASNTYVILLANAIHPRGAPPISALRGQVATAVARALGLSLRATMDGRVDGSEGIAPQRVKPDVVQSSNPADEAVGRTRPSTPWDGAGRGDDNERHVRSGIDVLEATQFAELKQAASRHGGHLRLGLLTNQTGIDARSHRTIDILHHADPAIELTTLFTPEHGLLGTQDTEHLTVERDASTKLPILSLYGPKPADKRPHAEDLAKLDAIVIDLQDAGVRFWTYETVLGYFLEATACGGPEIVVLDRPPLVGATTPHGPVSDAGSESYINYMPMPVEHAMTFGELAQYFRATHPCADHANARLTVIPMQGWTRGQFFAETGLPWVPPSPNMKHPETAIPYPGVALIETTNMSVGRGSPAPYENFGAAFVKSPELAVYLQARHISGVTFSATTLTIAETTERYPFHGQTIPGLHITVTDRALLDAPQMGVEIISALHHLYPAEFALDKVTTILRNGATLNAVRAGRDPRDIASTWTSSLAAFNAARQKYLLYP